MYNHNYYVDNIGKDHRGSIVQPQDNPNIRNYYYTNTGWSLKEVDGMYIGGNFTDHDGTVMTDVYMITNIRCYFDHTYIQKSDDQLYDNINKVQIPCETEDNGCKMPAYSNHTYIWDSTTIDNCPLTSIQEQIDGVLINDHENDILAFISTDDSNIRFILTHKTTICDTTAWHTNHPEFMVAIAEPDSVHPFPFTIKEPIPAYTFAYTNDIHLREQPEMHILEEYQRILYRHCETMRTSSVTIHEKTGRIYNVRQVTNDTFLYPAAETSYIFRCRQLVVTARETTKCYSTLPIKAPTAVGFPENTPLFLIPITRRITRLGGQIPCNTRFKNKFLNLDGRWVLHTPKLHIASQPDEAPKNRDTFLEMNEKIHNYENEDDEQLETFPALVQQFKRDLFKQTTSPQNPAYRYYKPEEIFPHSFNDKRGFSAFMYDLVQLLDCYGRFVSTFVGLWISVHLILFTGKLICKMHWIRQVYGYSFQALWAICCPTPLLLRKTNTTPKNYDARLPSRRPIVRTTLPRVNERHHEDPNYRAYYTRSHSYIQLTDINQGLGSTTHYNSVTSVPSTTTGLRQKQKTPVPDTDEEYN
jgi:hypothetical protein